MKNKDEYLMLRNEILHLSTLENNIINFFYVFVSGILLFALEQENSLFVLITYVVMIPAYRMVLSKKLGIYKIAAYLYVFQEGEEFNWENRQKKFYDILNFRNGKKTYSFNYPFLFVSTFVMGFFLMKTQWCDIKMTSEFVKVILAVFLYIFQLIYILKNRRITIEEYIPYWEKIKSEE